MKKFLCIVLAVLLCLPLLVACGKKTETPAAEDSNTNNADNDADRAAQQRAAQQQADKETIANAFSTEAFAEALQKAMGAVKGEEQGAGAGEEQPDFAPTALAEMLAATVEAYAKAGDAEILLDAKTPIYPLFEEPNTVLLSLKNGVLYGREANGNGGYLSIDQGMVTEVDGLPLETYRYDLAETIWDYVAEELEYYLENFGIDLSDLEAYMDAELPTEEIEAQLNAVIAALPALTAADLTADTNGVYVLTNDYIARFVIAVGEATGFFDYLYNIDPAAEPNAETAAEIAAAQQEIGTTIAEIVPALGLKIGFKLNGNDISALVLRFEPTAETEAVLAAMMPAPHKQNTPQTDKNTVAVQPAPAEEYYGSGDQASGSSEEGPGEEYISESDEPDYGPGEEPMPTPMPILEGVGYTYGEEDEDDDETSMFVPGTKMELVISLAGGMPAGMDMTLDVPEEVSVEYHLSVAFTAEGYPTRVDETLDVRGQFSVETHYTVAYAQGVVTALTYGADYTMYRQAIKGESVGRDGPEATDADRQWAWLYADITYHSEASFTLATFARQATGQPVSALYTVTYSNLQRFIDDEPVANFDNVQFTYDDADMSAPADLSFTLTSANNGQGLIRFVVTTVENGKDADVFVADMCVGDAPNFVAEADNPLTELSGVVEQLIEEMKAPGACAYTIGENTYYFYVTVEFGKGSLLDLEFCARFESCLPNTEPAPFDSYTVITVVDGQLVLTPVENNTSNGTSPSGPAPVDPAEPVEPAYE